MKVRSLFDPLIEALASQDRPLRAVGVDLGTTKSCIAVASHDSDGIRCACVPLDEPGMPPGLQAMPSVVATHAGEHFVGHAARRRLRTRGFQPGRGGFFETKNDIGLKLSYHRAPEGYRSPTDIATHILAELRRRTPLGRGEANPPLVVTVPASFHGAQRRATLEAASRAFGENAATCLLDEPYAALLDLLHRQPQAIGDPPPGGVNCLVFDFGGGTCDVAVFHLHKDGGGVLRPRLLATSRYHRIGGGDIDRAIVHGHLVPQLLQQHGLRRSDISWSDKRQVLEPQLLPLAEQLKLGVCRKLAIGAVDSIEAVVAGDHRIELGEREFFLSDPTLDAVTFDALLAPFIEPNPARPDSGEYVERQSVFVPVIQALTEAHLAPEDIDFVLLAGSSSLIPPVRRELARRFSAAILLSLGSEAELQGGIARGAALQALSLAATGTPLIAPVCSASLALRTRQGLVTLAEAGEPLPFERAQPMLLQAPASARQGPLDLAIEVVADGERAVGYSVWQLEAPVQAGEPLVLKALIDTDQTVHLHLARPEAEGDAESFEVTFDAPITHIDQGQQARCRLLEAEEAVRCDAIPRPQLGSAFTQMARDASCIGHFERALHMVSNAIQYDGATNYLLNLRAMYLEELGEHERAEAAYREAADWAVARFNLALFLKRRGRHVDALEEIEEVCAQSREPAYRVLKGDILHAMGRTEEARLVYQDAVSGVVDPDAHCGWGLGWLIKGARIAGQSSLESKLQAALSRRSEPEPAARRDGALLPDSAMLRAGDVQAA